MRYNEFVEKLNKDGERLILMERVIGLILEDKEEVLDKNLYTNYKMDGSKLDTSEQRKLKRRFGSELEDKFGDKIGDVEDYDYLGLKYKVDIIKDLDWDEFKDLVAYEEGERERIKKRIASQEIEKEDKIVSKKAYSTYCGEVKKEDLEKEINNFKKSFKEKNGESLKEVLDYLRGAFNEFDIKTCSIKIAEGVKKLESVINKYIELSDVDKKYHCIGLIIIESFRHIYNSQKNALTTRCGKEDLEGAKEIIDLLNNSLSSESDENIISGKTSFFKNQGLIFSKEFTKSLLENRIENNYIKNLMNILIFIYN